MRPLLLPRPFCHRRVTLEIRASAIGQTDLYYIWHYNSEGEGECVFGEGIVSRPYYNLGAVTRAWNSRQVPQSELESEIQRLRSAVCCEHHCAVEHTQPCYCVADE